MKQRGEKFKSVRKENNFKLLWLFIPFFSMSGMQILAQHVPNSNNRHLTENIVSDGRLDSLFQHPPNSSHPGVFWQWLSGNITREGITRDLEWMAASGLRKASIFHLGSKIGGDPAPEGPVIFNSKEWKDLLKYAAAESYRLGLTLGLHNSDGWGTSGGPWVKPEDAMKLLTYNKKQVTGPGNKSIRIPEPHKKFDYYRDIAVLAYPSKGPAELAMHRVPHQFTWFSARGKKVDMQHPYNTWPAAVDWRDIEYWHTQPLSALSDGNRLSEVRLPVPPKGHFKQTKPGEEDMNGTLEVQFEEPVTASSLILYPLEHRVEWHNPEGNGTMIVQARNNNGDWETVDTTEVGFEIVPARAEFETVTSDAFRVVIRDFQGSKKWMWWRAFSELELLAPGEQSLVTPRLHDVDMKSGMLARMRRPKPAGSVEDDKIIGNKEIYNLTDRLTEENTVEWNFPEGDWTILRIGYTVSGKTNHPPTEAGRGLEVDKLHPSGVEAQWEGFLGPLADYLQPYTGVSFTSYETDSWEAGSQNWTHDLEESFTKRFGYDLIPYLPVIAGEVVQSVEGSENVLRDWRLLLSEMITKNFYGRLTELCEEHGLELEAEMAGAQAVLSDPIANAFAVSSPMTEFWAFSGKKYEYLPVISRRGVRDAVAGAHLAGKNLIRAEAFTSGSGHWLHHPGNLKSSADEGFVAGLNYYYHHGMTHQPDEQVPGWNMDPWGIAYNRKLTWADEAEVWNMYLARSQALLQKGLPVVDLLWLKREDATNFLGAEKGAPFGIENEPFPGYKFDPLSPRVLKHLTVRNGRIQAKGGMSYRLLYIPARDALSLETLNELDRLAEAGAWIAGEKPGGVLGEPEDRKKGGAVIKRLWSTKRILSNRTPMEVLQDRDVMSDFTYTSPDTDPLFGYNHRTLENTDIYFVSNQRDREIRADLTFRVEGKTPEIWRADTGKRFVAPKYQQSEQGTTVALTFEPNGSAFVVFQPSENQLKNAEKETAERWPNASGIPANLQRYKEVNREWTVTFEPLAGPAPKYRKMQELRSWTEFNEPALKYLSGKGIYRTQFLVEDENIDEELSWYLDLGEVETMAEIELNGQNLGVLWKQPFMVAIGDAVKPGPNELKITVTNLWPNRLMGDLRLPDTARSTWTNNDNHWQAEDELLPSGLFGPVRIWRAIKNKK